MEDVGMEKPSSHAVTPFLWLGMAILLEATGTVLLKVATNDSSLYGMAYACYFCGLTMFSFVVKEMPLSLAYTLWCTLGVVGVCLLSQQYLKEEISTARWLCIVLTLPPLGGLILVD